MSTTMTQPVRSLARRPAVKVALAGALLLLLLLPSAWVDGLIGEREARQAEVRNEIARSWGPAQNVLGPILIVPVLTREPAANGSTGPASPPTTVRRCAHIVPQRLSIEAKLSPEQRRRGLFAAVVYGADVDLAGSFGVPDLAAAGSPDTEILWSESMVVAGASDLRASPPTSLRWNGKDVDANDDAPIGAACGSMAFQSWRLPTAPSPGQTIPFSTHMDLRGTGAFHVIPAARQLVLDVSAPWTTPSFTGAVLPTDSSVTDKGFAATWQDGSRPAIWFSNTPMTCTGPAATTALVQRQDGVDLLEALPAYRMVTRTAKYALLFLTLSFLTYFLFETLSGVPIHLVQYGLVGLSVCLFPLLLLALSEPLGFAPAYLIASGAVVSQASLFTWSVTRRTRLAALFAAMMTTVFGFLYVVLSLESLSLLVGAVALFLVLSVIMAATRRVDWNLAS